MTKTIAVCSAGLAFTLLAAPLQAMAINKCIGPDGKVSFQEMPCSGKGGSIEVKPASGAAPAPVSAASDAAPAAVAPPAVKTGKKEGVFGESYRRKLDLESHLIGNTRAELNSHLQACDANQRALASKKNLAKNNLAGATWEQSISAEMQAAALTCDTKARELRGRLEGYEKELRELKSR